MCPAATSQPDGARFVELPGADLALRIGDVEPVVEEVQEFLTRELASVEHRSCVDDGPFTDIVGSTDRAAELGDQHWRDVLDAHDRLAERQLVESVEGSLRCPAREEGPAGDVRENRCGEQDQMSPEPAGLTVMRNKISTTCAT